MPNEHLIRGADFDLREHVGTPAAIDHHEAIAVNPLAYIGLRSGGPKPAIQLRDYLHSEAATVDVPKALAPQPLPRGFRFGMLGNDSLGDCVPAEIVHSIEVFHIAAGTVPPPFVTADAISLYEAVGGYVPGDPSTDQGTDPGTAWDYWQSPGVKCAADKSVHQIAGLVGINPADEQERHLAIYEFDAVQYAIGLPLAWQGAAEWTGVPDGNANTAVGSWGGHGTCARGFDARGNEDIVTWGTDLLAASNSLGAYLQEAAVVVSREMLSRTGVSRCGIQWDDLLSDLRKVTGQRPVS